MSDRHQHPAATAAIAVLTVSDSRTPETDHSGAAAMRLLREAGHHVCAYLILRDEPDRVREQVETWIAQARCDGVIVSGGTGISTRDRTYEAVTPLLERCLDGFGELFRMLSFEAIGSAAMLSRAVAGVARGKPIFVVPGSTAAVELALRRLILPELGHLLGELRK